MRPSVVAILIGALWFAGIGVSYAQVEPSPSLEVDNAAGDPKSPGGPPSSLVRPSAPLLPSSPSLLSVDTDPLVDIAAETVVGTGCLHGVPSLARVVQSTSSVQSRAFGLQLLKLCENIAAADPQRSGLPAGRFALTPSSAPGGRLAPGKLDRSGRAKMVAFSTLYGLWVGIGVDILVEPKNAQIGVIPPLLGVGGALAASLYLTQKGEITSGQAWTSITGFDYGTYSGLLLAGALDGDDKAVVGAGLAAGAVGGTLASLIAISERPSAGDAEMVRSGGLWGLSTSLLGLLIAMPDNPSTTGLFTTMLVGMDGGLLAGGLLARATEVSRNRMLLVDAGALVGAVTGGGLTILAMGLPDKKAEGRVLGLITLASLWGGVLATVHLTKNMDKEDDEFSQRDQLPGLVKLDQKGRFSFGTLSVLPVLTESASGLRPTGLSVPLLGGAL